MLVRQHIDHAFNGKGFASVDPGDAALGDRGCNDTGMCEPGHIELAGVFRRAGDLGAAIDAGCGGADVSGHGPAPIHRIFLLDCDCGVPVAAWVSARMMARRETDLEGVMLEAFRIVQQEIRRAGERRLDGELTAQRRFD